MKHRRRTAVAIVAGLAAVAALAAPVVAGPSEPSPAASESANAAPTGLDAALEDHLARAASADPLLVFVHADDTAAAADAAREAGLTVVERFERVGVAVAAGVPDAIRALGADDRVLRVEADRELEWYLDTSHEATRGAEVIDGFDVTAPGGSGETRKDDKRNSHAGIPSPAEPGTSTSTYAFDGSGVSIAIVDSGIDATHPFFLDEDRTSKVARNLDLYCSDALLILTDDQNACSPAWVDDPYGDTDTNSVGGHGTHVAGIAGGYPTTLEDGGKIMGAAPGSTLIGLSVGATVSVYGGASGLNWVLENHLDPCGNDSCPPIKVVNNSWGSSGADHDAGGVHAKIVNTLVEEGVVVVFAQGNDGGDGSANNSNPHALNPTPGVLGVANYDDGGTGTRDGALTASSSRGEDGRPPTYPDIAAPGTNILSSCRAYQPICATGLDFVENGDYNTISGTSMAAPHIAGIVAQLFEADPGLTPREIEDALEDTAHKFATGGGYEFDATNDDDSTSFDKGHGLVDAVAAVSDVLGLNAPLASSSCVADGPVVVDAEDDATSYLGQPTPLESQPSLDIIEGRISEVDVDGVDGVDALRFSLEVAGLTSESPAPAGAVGEYFDWNFTYGGGGFYLGMGWDRTAEPVFLVGRFETTRRKLADLQGDYAETTDNIITVTLPFDTLSEALGDAVPVMEDGSVVGGHEIVARYDQGFVVPDADTATGSCPYTIGLGAVPPPTVADDDGSSADSGSGLPDGEPHMDIDESDPEDSIEAGPGTAVNIVGVSVGVTAAPSDTYTLDVIVAAAGGSVTISAVADNGPEVQDIDLSVYDQGGNKVGESALEGGTESVTFPTATVAQRYTIEVVRFATVEAGYTLTATLGATQG